MKNLLTKKDHRRRYYLHAKVKKEYVTDAHKREVRVPAAEIDQAKNNTAVMELCSRFGYNIQASII
jgi:hypothetical protein